MEGFEGYEEYKRREYCRVVQCPVQELLDGEQPGSDKYNLTRRICQEGCLQTAHSFHRYLIDAGYIVIRPVKS